MPHLRAIPLAGEALERYHFNRLQIRMEEHIIEGNDAHLFDDDDTDYDDEDDDHNEHEHDNDKTVGYLSNTIIDDVLVGYCSTPDELVERDPVSSIKRQRPNHDVHEQHGITKISEERNLHDIDSCINMKKRSKSHYDHDHYHESFSDQFEDLRQYKLKYGHCDVYATREFKSLADWCNQLRTSKKTMEGHLKGSTPQIRLSEEKVQQLTELGFNWMPRKTIRVPTFSDRFEELRQYKLKYGHCNVSSTGEFKSLEDWCVKVRTSKKMMEGRFKGSTPQIKLSEEKVQQLTELGFNWMGRERKRSKTFSDRFEELRQYKAKYGHCIVSSIGEFKSLAGWCAKVRTSKKTMDGHLKGSTPQIRLSEEKVQQLTELGFIWASIHR